MTGEAVTRRLLAHMLGADPEELEMLRLQMRPAGFAGALHSLLPRFGAHHDFLGTVEE